MPAGASRAAHEGACGGDARLRRPEVLSASGGTRTGRARARYKLIEQLGVGAHSVVWWAVAADGTAVALKRLNAQWSRHAGAVSLLQREYAWLRELSHETIVSTYGWVDAEAIEAVAADVPGAESPAMAMELLTGGDLVPLAGAHPRYWIATAIRIAEAMEYLHARGIVHGDIKARNILFDAADRPRLVDFSSAGRAGDRAAHPVGTLTQQRARIGGHIIGFDDDAYAFAALVFELLAGRAPFVGADGRRVERSPAELRGSRRDDWQRCDEALLDAVVGLLTAAAGADVERLAPCRAAMRAVAQQYVI